MRPPGVAAGSAVEQSTGSGHVVPQLGDERIYTIETAFTPQEISERDPA
jgi:hypothetical protein